MIKNSWPGAGAGAGANSGAGAASQAVVVNLCRSRSQSEPPPKIGGSGTLLLRHFKKNNRDRMDLPHPGVNLSYIVFDFYISEKKNENFQT